MPPRRNANRFMAANRCRLGEEWVVEEWHRPVGVICARRSAPEAFPSCSSFP